MEMSGNERQPMRRTIRGGRAYFFEDPAIDKLLNMVVMLGSEVWTLRERLAAIESIQTRRGGLAAGEVDAYEFSADEEARLAGLRKEFIDGLFRVLQEQVEDARERAVRQPRPEPVAATPPAKTAVAKAGPTGVKSRKPKPKSKPIRSKPVKAKSVRAKK